MGPTRRWKQGKDLGGVLLAAVLAVALAAPCASAATWSQQSVPALPSTTSTSPSAVDAVSCATATDCFAVGWSPVGAPQYGVLIEHWNGSGWSGVKAPSPRGPTPRGSGTDQYSMLTGISCPSTTACIAVGTDSNVIDGDGSFAESWNGSSWTAQTIPTPSGSDGYVQLNAVSCATATECFAVGGLVNSGSGPGLVAELFDGTSWTPLALTGPGDASGENLTSVACASTDACTAVGYYVNGSANDALAYAWNGTSLTDETPPEPSGAKASDSAGGLTGVACPAVTSCLAVGSYATTNNDQAAYSELWNGTTWTEQPVTATASATTGLGAVSCTTLTACTAVGIDGARLLAEAWNGTAWAPQATAPVPSGTQLDADVSTAVSCPVASSCLAVGDDEPGAQDDDDHPFAEVLGANGWTANSPPVNVTSADTELNDVSCASSTSCTAIGDGSNGTVPIAERWNGAHWVLQPLPNPFHLTSIQLSAIACPSVRWCMATGSFNFGGGSGRTAVPQEPMAERFNGSSWVSAHAPQLGGTLNSVACTSQRLCFAVGGGAAVAQWDGSGWSVMHPPGVPGLSLQLGTVACHSAGSCMIVGDAQGSCPNAQPSCFPPEDPIAEHWNGSSWSLQRPAQPGGGELDWVSCPTNRRCVAIGTRTAVWNGAAWSFTPHPDIDPMGLSCPSARTCVAFGAQNGDTQKLAAAGWNGTRWTAQSVPIPALGAQNALSEGGVSCVTVRLCFAAGDYLDPAGSILPFIARYG